MARRSDGGRDVGKREGRREEGIVTAHRQSMNVRYNELHPSTAHFWAEMDAGSFVAQKQTHGKVPAVSPSPSLPTRVAGCCLVSKSQESVFASALCSWSPGLGRVISGISQIPLWKDNLRYDGWRWGRAFPRGGQEGTPEKLTAGPREEKDRPQFSLPRADKEEGRVLSQRTPEMRLSALGIARKLL